MKTRLLIVVMIAAISLGAAGVPANVTGWVLDSACAYTKGLDKPISRECALACARKGSPLVLLRDDGTIFLPIAEDTPATGQNERLLPFAGKRVTVNGRIFTRAGSNGLVIDKIEAAK